MDDLKICPYCKECNPKNAARCSCGYYFDFDEYKKQQEPDIIPKPFKKMRKFPILFLIGIILPLFLSWFVRYYLDSTYDSCDYSMGLRAVGEAFKAFAICFPISEIFIIIALVPEFCTKLTTF